MGGGAVDLKGYVNIPSTIGAVVSNQLATLHELDTVYGLEDLYDMLEVLIIDAHNRRLLEEKG